MSINAQSGLITWILGEEQGQETFLVIVRAEDTLGMDEQSFRVGVDAASNSADDQQHRAGPCERWRPVHV